MKSCNEMDYEQIGPQLLIQSIRLYFANIGFHDGSDNPAVLNRATSRMQDLIDLVDNDGVRNAMHDQVNYALSDDRDERTFHTSWARMQMDMLQWTQRNNQETPATQSLMNYYLQPLLQNGPETTRLLYLRFLARMCVHMDIMSFPDFSKFLELLDQGATLQEDYKIQGFIFSLKSFVKALSFPNATPQLLEFMGQNFPETIAWWKFNPNEEAVSVFFDTLAMNFNPIPGVCE